MTEHAGEQRNRHTAKHADTAERTARRARAAACLRIGRLFHLGGKLRHKPQRDTHNHAELVCRKPHARKWCEQTLKTRGEIERRRGECNGAHAGHHQGQAARHKRRRTQRALAHLHKAKLPQDAATLIGKQVEHRNHYDNRQQWCHR